VSAENFLGEGAKGTQPKPRNSTNKPPSILWVRGCTMGMQPGLTSRKRCTKSPAQKMKAFLWRNTHFRKNAHFIWKFQHNFVRKTLYPGLHLALNHLPF